MKKTIITTTALALKVSLFTSGCESQEAANVLAGIMPQLNLSGPGGHHTYRVPASTFYSSSLKFQEAVVKNNTAKASLYIKPNLVEKPIKNHVPIYYAALNGNSTMIHLLVRTGASVRHRFGGKSLAFVAAAHGHVGTASDLVAMGGGTSNDIAGGRHLYTQNAAIQRQQAAMLMTGALLFLDASSKSSNSERNLMAEQSERIRVTNIQGH